MSNLGREQLGKLQLGTTQSESASKYAHGQAQALIISGLAFGQAQAQIKQIYRVHGQSQAQLLAFDVPQFGQAQALIDQYLRFAQAQAALIRPLRPSVRVVSVNSFSTGDKSITINKPAGTADGDLLFVGVGVDRGSFNGTVWDTASGWTRLDTVQFGQSHSGAIYFRVASSEPSSWTFTYQCSGGGGTETGAVIVIKDGKPFLPSNALTSATGNAVAAATITEPDYHGYLLLAVAVLHRGIGTYAMANGYTDAGANFLFFDDGLPSQGFATKAFNGINPPGATVWNTDGTPVHIVRHFAIEPVYNPVVVGQAAARIVGPVSNGYAQAQAHVYRTWTRFGQAQAFIGHFKHGLAQARIVYKQSPTGQAQALILTKINPAQAQAYIQGKVSAVAQAAAQITTKTPNAQAQAWMRLIIRPAQAQSLIAVVANARVTQSVLEVVYAPTSGKARVTQAVTENLVAQAQGKARLTQTYIEVALRPEPEPHARISQAVVEVLVKRFIQLSQGYGQAQARIASNLYVKDTFTRTTSVGVIGSPDVGPNYSGGDVSDIYVDGAELILDTSVSDGFPPSTTLSYEATPSLSIPSYLSPITDPTWGTRITRISNVHARRHVYPRTQPWNSDESRLLLSFSWEPGYALLNGSTFAYIKQVSAPGDAFWSATDPDIIYGVWGGTNQFAYYDISDDSSGTIRTFTGYTDVRVGNGENGPDDDTKYVLLFGTKTSTRWLIVYDIELDSIISETDLGVSVANQPNNGTMSPSGDLIVLVWSNAPSPRGNVTEVWGPRNSPAYIRTISPTAQHGDCGFDSSGNQVYFESGSLVPMHRLDGAGTTNLLTAASVYGASHISARNTSRPGWVYVSHYESGTTTAGNDQVVAIKADGSGTVQVFAHAHHLTGVDPYEAQPHAVPNRLGNVVLFASEWEEVDNNPVYAYVAQSIGGSDRDLVNAISPIDVADTDAKYEFISSALDGNLVVEISTRLNTSNNDRVSAIADAINDTLTLQWLNDPSSDDTSTVFNFTADTYYVIKLRAEGSTIKSKVWERNGIEPDWMLTLNSVGRTASGAASFKITDTTSSTAVIKGDNWFVSGPDTSIWFQGYAQAEAIIFKFFIGRPAQAQALIHRSQGYGQAGASIVRKEGYAQAQARINLSQGHGQSQAHILRFGVRYGLAIADIKVTYFVHALALAYITRTQGYGQAEAFIAAPLVFGQAQAHINPLFQAYGQAIAFILTTLTYGQAQAEIVTVFTHNQIGHANALISKSAGYGQAQAFVWILDYSQSGQAQAFISKTVRHGQAQAMIRKRVNSSGQAMAFIGHIQVAHAQAFILTDQTYVVQFNGRRLPGWAQHEAIDSIMNISDAKPPYEDGSLSEYLGLKNKILSLRMRVWENTYGEVKRKVQLAGTIIRSGKGFERLYIQSLDKHYEALAKSITYEKEVRSPMRIADYEVQFETKPWLVSDATYTISGIGTIDTDQVARDLTHGGWTPVKLTLTGTDITVSGYTATGDFAGFLSVSGAVTNLVIDSVEYTATINNENKNDTMNNVDYAIYVGPGKTFFEVTGATDCVIEYNDRWYL